MILSTEKLNKLFTEHQSDLLWMVNTDIGKQLLGCELPQKIITVTPNAYYVKNGEKLTGRFYTHAFVAETFLSLLEKMLLTNTTHYKGLLHFTGIKKQHFPDVYLDTYTFNPRAGGSGSGRIQSGGSNNFTTVRSGNSLSVISSIGQLLIQLSGGNYSIDRDFHPFDTSSLPTGVISSAFVRYVGTADNNNADSISLHVVESLQASVSTLATSDWGNIGATSFGSIAKASWNQSGNNDIALNAAGIAKITPGGNTKLAAIADRDLNNSAPTGVNIFGISSIGTIVLSVTVALDDNAYFV